MAAVSADELLEKIERGGDFVLVDALAPMAYAHSHLPGAINLAPPQVDDLRCSKLIPRLDTEIVVYCSNPECHDSHATIERLRALGYTNVRHYPGGKDEWKARGFPLERAGKPYKP